MIRQFRCVFLVMLVCALCQWMAPARMTAIAPTSASVPGITCTASMTSITFGNVDPTFLGIGGVFGNSNGNSNLSTTGFLTYYCTNATATAQTITACFSIGNPGGTTQRAMIGPGNTQLNYQLYQDAANSQPWGSKTNSAWGSPDAVIVSVPPNGTSAPVQLPVYATIASSQGIGGIFGTPQSGSYIATYGSGDVALDTGPQTGGCNAASGGGTITGFPVTANVQQTCQVTTNPLTFPTAGGDPSSTTSSTTLMVTCTAHTGYQIGLDNGKNWDGATRRMRGGPTYSDYIGYGLYQDNNYTIPWGNTRGSDTVTGDSSNCRTGPSQQNNTFCVYGKVNANQGMPAPGNYFDAVTVYVYY